MISLAFVEATYRGRDIQMMTVTSALPLIPPWKPSAPPGPALLEQPLA